MPLEEQSYEEAADERLNWPSVTLHIAASELGVMGETGGGEMAGLDGCEPSE